MFPLYHRRASAAPVSAIPLLCSDSLSGALADATLLCDPPPGDVDLRLVSKYLAPKRVGDDED